MSSNPDLFAWLQTLAEAFVFLAIVGYGGYISLKMRQQGASWIATGLAFLIAAFLALGLAGMTVMVFKTILNPPATIDPDGVDPAKRAPD